MPRLFDFKKLKNNTFRRLVKKDGKDRIEVEIGDIHSAEFQPQAKIKRWGNETNFSIRRQKEWVKTPKLQTKGSTAIFGDDDEEVHIYEKPEVAEDGGLEIELVLKTKPTTNRFDFSIETKGLDFFYQPDQRDDPNIEQPENVVGSYAVYHQSKGGMNDAAGMDYKMGKFCHIYRPKIVDANGNETWGDLFIDEKKGVLSVTVPQTFLDEGVYPIKVDPTIGNTSAGASVGIISAHTILASFTNNQTGGLGGKVTEIQFYGSTEQASQNVSAAIYNTGITANHLTPTSGSIPVSASTEWASIPFSGPLLAANTQYGVAIYFPGSASPDRFIVYYDVVGNTSDKIKENVSTGFPTFPNPVTWDGFAYDSQHNEVKYSIYAKHTQAAPVTVQLSDSGSGADSVGVQIEVDTSDTGSGSDTPQIETTLAQTDTGSGSDSLSLLSSLGLSDAGTSSEVLSALASLGFDDTGAGLDTLSIEQIKEIVIQDQNQGQAQYFANWSYYTEFTIPASSVSGDLTDYPVYLDLADMPADFWNHVQSDGGDLRIALDDGATEVPLEVVNIDTVNKTGEVHFKYAGTLSSSVDNTFRVYYGNTGASGYADSATYGTENVWTNGFAAVYHMNQADVADSTANGNDGTAVGNPQVVNGTTGKAVKFDGTNWISLGTIGPSSSLYMAGSDVTISVWLNQDMGGDDFQRVIEKSDGGGFASSGYGVWIDRTGDNTFNYAAGPSSTFSVDTVLPFNEWVHITATLGDSDSDWRAYNNGVLQGFLLTEQSQQPPAVATNMRIGGRPTDTARQFTGALDEVRISSVARTSAWISTSYTNQNTPTTFYMVGTQETNGGAGTTETISVSKIQEIIKAVSDTATSQDTLSLVASLALVDSGTGNEALSLLSTIAQSDSATATDAVEALAQVALSDAGSAGEVITILTEIAVADTGASSEAVQALVTLAISDTPTSTDIVTILASIAVSNTGNGTDIANALIAIAQADTGAGNEVVSVLAQVALSDSGTSDEAVGVLSQIAVGDSGVANEAVEILAQILASDSGAGVDTLLVIKNIYKALSDSGAGLDTVLVELNAKNVTLTDSGTASEALSLLSMISLYETGAGVDNVLLGTRRLLTDAGSGSEVVAILSNLALADSGQATDALSVLAQVVLADSGVAIDNEAVTAMVKTSDSGLGQEVLEVLTSLVVSDSGLADEALELLVTIAVSDSAIATEAITALEYAGYDYFRIKNQYTPRTDIYEKKDRYTRNDQYKPGDDQYKKLN